MAKPVSTQDNMGQEGRSGTSDGSLTLPNRPPFVDAHHHLWNRAVLPYPWLEEPGVDRLAIVLGDYSAIRCDYLIDELLGEYRQANVVKSVHVESATSGDPVSESAWLQSIADVAGFPHAFVVAADLGAADSVRTLERHLEFPNVRGVRQRTGRDDPTSVAFRTGFRLLRPLGLSFELNAGAAELRSFAPLVRANPDTIVVVGHGGLPADRSKDGLARWRAALRSIAAAPNSVVKISGLPMYDHRWTVASLRVLVRQIVEIFAPRRCFFGTNWPVDGLYSRYAELVDAYLSIVSEFTAAEQVAMMRGNAERVYRI
jgi:predicted TIM-barrel fold metal-dependent hydrolase